MIPRPEIPSRPHLDEPDICVVGCGAGGAVIAKELAEGGLRVVVLEAGPRYDPLEHYATHRDDWEIARRTVFRAPDPRSELYTWTPWRDASGERRRFHLLRVKAVGGSTLHYAMVSARLRPPDFAVRSTEGIAEDWPLTYEDLRSSYHRVEQELGVSGDASSPPDPPREPCPNPPFASNCAARLLARGAHRLGWSVHPVPLAALSRPYEGRPACNHCGACTAGCMTGAKSTVDVTYLVKGERTGRLEVRPRCTATDVLCDRRGRARGVAYRDAAGTAREVRARVIVLAGGAVETPRLLLLSRSPSFPEGLANWSGLVGRYFMSHVFLALSVRFPERIDGYRGVLKGGMIQDHSATRTGRPFLRGFTFFLDGDKNGPVGFARGLRGWGASHREAMRRDFGHVAVVDAVGEQLPVEGNRIELDTEARDPLGLPVPRLTNIPSASDRALQQAMEREARALAEAAGGTVIGEPLADFGLSGHYLGGCRMGRDPRSSVVDPFGRTHDVPNLFVADGSLFVTGGAVPPTLTIQALATRTAAFLLDRARKGEI